MESYLWLKNSKTYQSINGDDSEDITEHVKHLCQPVINGPSDVAQILGAIQYWDVYEIPANIILYFATHLICSDDIPFIIEKEWLDLFTKLFYLYNTHCIANLQIPYDGGKLLTMGYDIFKSCVRMDVYRVFVSSFGIVPLTNDYDFKLKIVELLNLACYVGNLECVQYIYGMRFVVGHSMGEHMAKACIWSIVGKMLIV